MSQGSKFHQYGYNHYLKAPVKPNRSDEAIYGLRASLLRNIQTPAIATVVLVSAAILFVGVIMMTYPSDDNNRQIPIIKADMRPIKSQPLDRGGMNIPYSDSTVLSDAGIRGVHEDVNNIENLLAQSNYDALISKEKAIEMAMARNPMAFSAVPEGDIPAVVYDGNNKVAVVNVHKPMATPSFDLKEPVAPDIKEIALTDILQKIGTSSKDISDDNDEFNKKVVTAALSVKPLFNRKVDVKASPDTMDFVRQVLNKKVGDVASIEPAAGVASSATINDIFFVQLASITDSTRAGSEWMKMQSRYDVLSSSKFRVQEASLSGRNFYRIQAGPMSKAKANEICNSLKAQGKAGGCLVVK